MVSWLDFLVSLQYASLHCTCNINDSPTLLLLSSLHLPTNIKNQSNVYLYIAICWHSAFAIVQTLGRFLLFVELFETKNTATMPLSCLFTIKNTTESLQCLFTIKTLQILSYNHLNKKYHVILNAI